MTRQPKTRTRTCAWPRTTPRWAVAALVLILMPPPISSTALALATSGSLPDAATILDRFVEVTGGKAAYERVHNRVRIERVVFVGMGFEAKATSYAARPNKNLLIFESDVLGGSQQGSDGEVVWLFSEQTGPLVERGAARTVALRDMNFDRVWRWRDFYKTAECVGEEVVESRPCYKVVMTPAEGKPETRYYDKESGLLVRALSTRISSLMPDTEFETSLDDYRRVDGLLLPHERKQVYDQCGSKREMLFITESIEHNATLPANRFDPPDEVREIVKDGAAARSAVRPSACKSPTQKP